jgi:hypothetical protein
LLKEHSLATKHAEQLQVLLETHTPFDPEQAAEPALP